MQLFLQISKHYYSNFFIAMNHLIFITHITVISAFTLLFGSYGKSALVSYVSLLFVLANMFVIKEINMLNFVVTTTDAYIIGISFGINIIQEIWGKRSAQKTIFISFGCSLLYLIMGYFQIWYIPAAHDISHVHFDYLMNHSLRIITASFISYLTVQYADTIMYGYLKQKTDGKYFIIRNYISMLSSQLFDTILFSFLGLYGIVHNIGHIILVSYCVKIMGIALTTPFMLVAKKFIKKS
ncbi:queuosine precursor transporter [Candidatus Babeliales bacterium]|nr:queuosine precursor transporter [Candidatus Babeliales bacterium]MBP9844258.1 queuosine precursor transporter [Candidatus Babeliales bacterium]